MSKHLRKIAAFLAGGKYAVVRRELAEYPARAIASLGVQPRGEGIDSVIFSKDRAMQLHAFIESYFARVEGAGRLYVLYKAEGGHRKSYEELREIWRGHDVRFVEEVDFRVQLLEICNASRARLIGFYVDDMIFAERVSYREIASFDPLEYVVCLSRGLDFDYSQVLGKPLSMPPFERVEGSAFFGFPWNHTAEKGDWTYPLGVSAYFYSRREVAAMFDLIAFRAPNSLEIAMQIFKPLFAVRKGLCMERIACTCVPVNLVQQECSNPVTGGGENSAEGLLAKWNAGLKIDIARFEGVGARGIYMDYDYVAR